MKEGFESPAVTATGDELTLEKSGWNAVKSCEEGFSLTDIIRNQQSVERKKFEK